MSLEEKFVLSFEQISSETSDAVDYAVFKVSISTPKLVFDAIIYFFSVTDQIILHFLTIFVGIDIDSQ